MSRRKKRLVVLLVLLILLFAAVLLGLDRYGPSFGIYLRKPTASAYGERAIALMSNGYYSSTDEWQEARAKALESLQDVRTYEETYPILSEAIAVAGGKHSRVVLPQEMTEMQAVDFPTSSIKHQSEGRLVHPKPHSLGQTGKPPRGDGASTSSPKPRVESSNLSAPATKPPEIARFQAVFIHITDLRSRAVAQMCTKLSIWCCLVRTFPFGTASKDHHSSRGFRAAAAVFFLLCDCAFLCFQSGNFCTPLTAQIPW